MLGDLQRDNAVRRLSCVAGSLQARSTVVVAGRDGGGGIGTDGGLQLGDEQNLLQEQFYRLDLDGYLVIEDALPIAQVDILNALIDTQGVRAGVPEVYPADAPGGTWTGSPIRFGSAGGGAPSCPGFLDWGQPFCDLLLHPRILPFLSEFLDSSGYGVRLDRL